MSTRHDARLLDRGGGSLSSVTGEITREGGGDAERDAPSGSVAKGVLQGSVGIGRLAKLDDGRRPGGAYGVIHDGPDGWGVLGAVEAIARGQRRGQTQGRTQLCQRGSIRPINVLADTTRFDRRAYLGSARCGSARCLSFSKGRATRFILPKTDVIAQPVQIVAIKVRMVAMIRANARTGAALSIGVAALSLYIAAPLCIGVAARRLRVLIRCIGIMSARCHPSFGDGVDLFESLERRSTRLTELPLGSFRTAALRRSLTRPTVERGASIIRDYSPCSCLDAALF
jgi:hypothetical protein